MDKLKALNVSLNPLEEAMPSKFSQTHEEHVDLLEEFKSFKVKSKIKEDRAFEEGMKKAEGPLK